MEMKSEQFIIKEGLDREDVLLLWPITEWVIAVLCFGMMIILHRVLIGLGLMLTILYLFVQFRNEDRGHKEHLLWRFNMWKSKKGFWWAPPAHATRFDN